MVTVFLRFLPRLFNQDKTFFICLFMWKYRKDFLNNFYYTILICFTFLVHILEFNQLSC